MKKLYILLFALFSFAGSAFSQPYGNEWINFATNQQYSIQQYFKVTVWRDGIYRITYADLQTAAFPQCFRPSSPPTFLHGARAIYSCAR